MCVCVKMTFLKPLSTHMHPRCMGKKRDEVCRRSHANKQIILIIQVRRCSLLCVYVFM